jgi:nitrogen-specific signal transduction histidine kinase
MPRWKTRWVFRGARLWARVSGYVYRASVLRERLGWHHRQRICLLRYDAFLKRLGTEPMPVHVIITRTDTLTDIIVELVPQEQQTRQDREERLAEQAQTNKELIRNLAHEIKNPLGGIGALRSCWRWKWSHPT